MGRPCQCCDSCETLCGWQWTFPGGGEIGAPCKLCRGRCPEGAREGCRQSGWSVSIHNGAYWAFYKDDPEPDCLFRLEGDNSGGKAAWMVPVLCRPDPDGPAEWYPAGQPLRVSWSLYVQPADLGFRAWCGLAGEAGVMLDTTEGFGRGRVATLDNNGDYLTLGDLVIQSEEISYGLVDLEFQINRYAEQDGYRWTASITFWKEVDPGLEAVPLLIQRHGVGLTFPAELYAVFGAEIGEDGQRPKTAGGTNPSAVVVCADINEECDVCGYQAVEDMPGCWPGPSTLRRLPPPATFEVSADITTGGDNPLGGGNVLPFDGDVLQYGMGGAPGADPTMVSCGTYRPENNWPVWGFYSGVVESDIDPPEFPGGPWKEDLSIELYKPSVEFTEENPNPDTGLYTLDLIISYRVYTMANESPFNGLGYPGFVPCRSFLELLDDLDLTDYVLDNTIFDDPEQLIEPFEPSFYGGVMLAVSRLHQTGLIVEGDYCNLLSPELREPTLCSNFYREIAEALMEVPALCHLTAIGRYRCADFRCNQVNTFVKYYETQGCGNGPCDVTIATLPETMEVSP